MQIFVEPSDYVLRNSGDTAMLEVAITRLGGLFPHIDQRFERRARKLPALGAARAPGCRSRPPRVRRAGNSRAG